jgi:hypothetical protein
MSCVYTGARILVVEYGFMAPADLYLVSNAIIARWNIIGQQWVETKEQMDDVTHKLFCNPSCWMREDLGVIVVPELQCEGPLHLEPFYIEIKSAD